MSHWLHKGILAVNKDEKRVVVKQYEEIPSGLLDSKRVKQLEDQGKIGSLPKAVVAAKAASAKGAGPAKTADK